MPLVYTTLFNCIMKKNIFPISYQQPIYTSYACGFEKALQLLNEYEVRGRKRKKVNLRLS
jgi:hypothetical protein